MIISSSIIPHPDNQVWEMILKGIQSVEDQIGLHSSQNEELEPMIERGED